MFIARITVRNFLTMPELMNLGEFMSTANNFILIFIIHTVDHEYVQLLM